jgi:hypothetical protein
MLSALLALALVPTSSMNLHGGARLVDDQDRPAAVVRHVDLYEVGVPQPDVGTREFGPLLAANAGQALRVCVRSHATKRGALVVSINRAVDQAVSIPTPVGHRYRTRCAGFTVRDSPRSWPGSVQVANDGVIGRVDFIRNVSIRPVST